MGWPADRVIELPFPDCSQPVVTYVDEAGADQVFAGSNYVPVETVTGTQLAIYSDAPLPALKSGHPQPVRISFTSGFGVNETDVPAAIRHAMLILIGDMWHARESFVIGARVSETRSAATIEHLIGGYRRSGLGLV